MPKRNSQENTALPSIIINPIDSAEMILIPAGTFIMGSNQAEREKPHHEVMLDSYYVYKHPVTVAQYQKFCRERGRDMPAAPYFNPHWVHGDHPVVLITWQDATSYCVWAETALPSEAQWEKAARGTDGRIFPWGNDWDIQKVCSEVKAPNRVKGTDSIGSYPLGVSPYGIHDMAGNVAEWCRDWYDETFYQSAEARMKNPVNLKVSDFRTLRGGSYYQANSDYFRCANRGMSDPDNTFASAGLRCVRLPFEV